MCGIDNSKHHNVIDVAAILNVRNTLCIRLDLHGWQQHKPALRKLVVQQNNAFCTAEGHSSFFHLKNSFDLEFFVVDESRQLNTPLK
jgi:hypothetical protein